MLITEIAIHLGVSPGSVSLVVNGKAQQGGISDAVAQRVLSYVEAVGYKPKQVAQGLRTGKTGLIGPLVDNIADPFTAHLIEAVENLVFAYGYQLLLGSPHKKADKARKHLTAFRESKVEAYIIMPSPCLEEDISAMMREQVPLILLNHTE